MRKRRSQKNSIFREERSALCGGEAEGKEEDLKGSEEGILKANVNTDKIEDNGRGLVGLEGRRDGELGRRVTIENVDELLLLNRTNHHGAPLGVRGQVLTRHNATTTCAPIGLLVDLIESERGEGPWEEW